MNDMINPPKSSDQEMDDDLLLGAIDSMLEDLPLSDSEQLVMDFISDSLTADQRQELVMMAAMGIETSAETSAVVYAKLLEQFRGKVIELAEKEESEN